MPLQQMHPASEQDTLQIDGGTFSRTEIQQQLERLLASKHFRNSKRYPAFLRFVVEQTLAGNAAELKERTLGVEVFARRNDYDTNDDPVVRVTAGETRKRLAQYYWEPGHEDELRLEMPLGSYVPHFAQPGKAPAREEPVGAPVTIAQPDALPEPMVLPVQTVARAPRSRFLLVAALVAVVAVACVLSGWMLLRAPRAERGIEAVWQPLLSSPNPILVVIGVHTMDRTGHEERATNRTPDKPVDSPDMLDSMVRSEMVPVSDIVSYSRMTDVLSRHAHTYETMGSSEATLDHLRKGPLLLLGGLDNFWTLRLTGNLRFRFEAATQSESAIVDTRNPSHSWHFDNLQPATGNTQDYAIVASYFDPTVDQPVLMAAGIGKAGTQVASEFLTSNHMLQSWLQQQKVPAGKNVELVLATEVVDGKAGPPHVVDASIW